MRDSKAIIKAFWGKVLQALSASAALAILALAHWVVSAAIGLSLKDKWQHYREWVEAVTFCVFYAVYLFLLVDILELFWPKWLKIPARTAPRETGESDE